MNERDIPQFDLQGVKSIIDRFNHIHASPVEMTINKGERPLLCEEVDRLSKLIIEYAVLCGVIHPRSSMK